ncbi:MAG: response regulator transcription factor [Candidatus Izemoplasmataceae bacterium]
MDTKQILIIEDEPTINRIVASYFAKEGFVVFSAKNGFEGLEIFNREKIDLICLDIMIPRIDGWNVAKTIRKSSDVPIIIMSALSEEEDVLKGYSLQVDDYITKPFNPKILVAKAKNLLTRTTISNAKQNILKAGFIKLNVEQYRAYYKEDELNLSKTEFELLKYFVKHQGKICSRSLLLDEVWGIDVYVEERIVDTYVKKLRKHLKESDHYIQTVFGVGYRFETLDE